MVHQKDLLHQTNILLVHHLKDSVLILRASGGSSLEGSDITISSEIIKNKNMCLRLFKCFHEAGDKDLLF